MSGLLPEGDDLRRAVKWVSEHLQEDPQRPVGPLVQEATFRFDLSPKDSDFLLGFFREAKARFPQG